MDLGPITKIATRVQEQLAPFCERIEIAGSIRRQRPQCNDIDMVVMLKPNQARPFRFRVLQHTQMIREGDDLMSVRLKSGLQLDIFFTSGPVPDLLEKRPGNWGSVLLNRTGSVHFNVWLAAKAKRLGMHWNPIFGLFGRCPRTGREAVCLAAATEEEMFQTLKLRWYAPTERETFPQPP